MRKNSNATQPLSTAVNALWNAIGCFFYLGCQWATTVLVVVLSSNYSNSGLLAFAMSVGNIFSSIALFKVRTYQVSDITYRYTILDYGAFRIATIATSAIITIIYLLFTSNNESFVFISLIYLLFKADEAFSDVLYGTVQRHERMDYIGKSQILRGFATLIGFVGILALTKQLFAAIACMALLCILVTVLYDRRNALRFEVPDSVLDKSKLIELAKACVLPMLSSVFANSIVSVARQEYGILQGEELLGIYASIATPAVLIQVAGSYLYSPLYGKLAATLQRGGVRAFKRQFSKLLCFIFIIMIAIVIALSLLGAPLLLKLYGEGIADYLYIFPCVLGATAAMGLLFYINDMLIVLRDKYTQVFSNLVGLATSSALVPPLVAFLGMNGVNISVILGITLSAFIGLIRILTSRDSLSEPQRRD